MDTQYQKYPRTPHLPFSGGATDDDKTLLWDELRGTRLAHADEIIVTEKMDGENFSGYADGHFHARSIDSRHHPSRDWVAKKWSEVYYLLPEGHRVCAENLYAKHSIHYEDLESYLYVFSIWDRDECLSWDETVDWCQLLGLVHVPVLYRGPFDEGRLEEIAEGIDTDSQEGYVVRVADSFCYDGFGSCVAKWVREDHVQTSEHWMHKEVVPNDLKEE